MRKFRRFDNFAQRNRLAMRVRNLDSYSGFSGDALDKNRFRPQREAQIVSKSGDAAVLDSRFRFQFERGDHRPGVDLRDVSGYVELRAFLLDGARIFLQFRFRHALAAVASAKQARGREAVRSFAFGDFWLGRRLARLRLGIAARSKSNRWYHAPLRLLNILRVFLIIYDNCALRRFGLIRHRRTARNFYFLDALAQLLGLAPFPPIAVTLDERVNPFSDESIFRERPAHPFCRASKSELRRQK